MEYKFYQHIDKLTWKFVYSWIYDKFYDADLSVRHAEIGQIPMTNFFKILTKILNFDSF